MKYLFLLFFSLLSSLSFAAGGNAGDVFNHLYSRAGSPGYDQLGPASTSRALVVSNATLAADGSNALKITRTAQYMGGGGAGVSVVYRSAANMGAVAAGIAGAARILYPPAAAVITASAIYDLAKELSFDFGRDPSGELIVKKKTYIWNNNYQQGSKNYSSAHAACVGLGFAGAGAVTVGGTYAFAAGCIGGAGYFAYVPNGTQPVDSPSSMQELQDEIASKSGWPTTSKIVQATLEAARVTKKAPDEQGDTKPDGSPNPDRPTVTGPSSSPGPSSVTTRQNEDGSTTTTTTNTTNNYKYEGSKISVDNSTTTTTQTCTGAGSCSSTTSSTTTKPVPTPTDCELNPSSIGCSDFGDAPTAEKLKNKDQEVKVTPVAFASSGSCPAPLSMTAFGQTYQISYQPLCDQMSIFRALFLVMSAFVAAWILANSFKV